MEYLNKLYNESNFPDSVGECPKCGGKLRFVKKTKLTNKDLKKQWFFTQFLKCNNCSYIKLDNNDRIINETLKK